MVNIVDKTTDLTWNYTELKQRYAELLEEKAVFQETNASMAKENGELRQLLGLHRDVIHNLQSRLRTDNEIFNEIKNIILRREAESAENFVLALPEPQRNESFVNELDKITERSENTFIDSLDPPDVTSVPPLVSERILNTPSIFRCLDSEVSSSIDTSINAHQDILHSTPRMPKAKSNIKRKAASPPKKEENDENISKPEPRYNLRKRNKT